MTMLGICTAMLPFIMFIIALDCVIGFAGAPPLAR